MVDMSVGMWAGIFVASPLIFYQLWQFIAPGLYKRERRLGVVFAISSAILFVCGALFCFYFALPKLYNFLLSYNSRNLLSLPNIQEYLDLTRDSMLAGDGSKVSPRRMPSPAGWKVASASARPVVAGISARCGEPSGMNSPSTRLAGFR